MSGTTQERDPAAVPAAAVDPGRTRPTLTVEVWSDVACPWCFIGKRRLATALAAFEHRDDVELVWRSYQLQPHAPRSAEHPGRTEAEMLAAEKGLGLGDVRAMFAQVTAIAAGEGLAYDFDTVVPANTWDAHRLIHLAARDGRARADAMVEALMRAHFERGLAVDDPAVLAALAAEVGLDFDDAARALAAGDAADAVRADVDEARALGVTGVPFVVLDRRYAVSGAQPAELFLSALRTAWDGLAGAPAEDDVVGAGA